MNERNEEDKEKDEFKGGNESDDVGVKWSKRKTKKDERDSM